MDRITGFNAYSNINRVQSRNGKLAVIHNNLNDNNNSLSNPNICFAGISSSFTGKIGSGISNIFSNKNKIDISLIDEIGKILHQIGISDIITPIVKKGNPNKCEDSISLMLEKGYINEYFYLQDLPKGDCGTVKNNFFFSKSGKISEAYKTQNGIKVKIPKEEAKIQIENAMQELLEGIKTGKAEEDFIIKLQD